MTARAMGRLRAPLERSGSLDRYRAVVSCVALVVLLCLTLPWLGADPPHSLTVSNSPYTDEGFYSQAPRSLVLFGSFGHLGRFSQFTNSGYSVVESAVFWATGPSIVAARLLSVVSVCLMVLLALLGLERPLGRSCAALIAAGLGGSQLILLYSHLGIVEPFELMLSVGAFVVSVRALEAGRPAGGVCAGLLMAAAMTSKASAFVAVPAVIGVPLLWGVMQLRTTGDARILKVAGASLAAMLLAAAVWLLVVALPHWGDLRAGWKTLNDTDLRSYPTSVGGVVSRLTHWLTRGSQNDHATMRTLPLLIAVLGGTVGMAWQWRSIDALRRITFFAGVAWALTGWLLPALSVYTPNRFFLPAIPGLALAAGPGLAAVGERLTRIVGLLPRLWLGAAVAGLTVPGAFSYLTMESSLLGTDQLARAERTLDAALPAGSVLYGIYAPEVALPSRSRIVLPWPASGLHMRRPVASYGVDYVITDISRSRSPSDEAVLRAVIPSGETVPSPVVTVRWGPHLLALYRVPSAP